MEEQITFPFYRIVTCRLIEKLEDETDRAQSATKNLHTNLKKKTLQREQHSIVCFYYSVIANSLLNLVLLLLLVVLLLILIYIWKH